MTKQELLDSVDQFRVMSYLTGMDHLKRKFCSPFRPDKHPSCTLTFHKGSIKFNDWAQRLHWDIVDCYSYHFLCKDWKEICEQIMYVSGKSMPTIVQVKKGLLREPKLIRIPIVCEWTTAGEDFWRSRINLKYLDGNVSQIAGYRRVGTNKEGNELDDVVERRGFCYWLGPPEDKRSKFKMYFPNTEYRFLAHHALSPNDTMLIRRCSMPSETVLIAKSNKDGLDWTGFVKCDIMAVNAESSIPDDDWLFTNLRLKYKRAIICFDPDPTGIKFSEILANKLEQWNDIDTKFIAKVWNWPDTITKDLDKYLVQNGYDLTKKYLHENNFYKIFDI